MGFLKYIEMVMKNICKFKVLYSPFKEGKPFIGTSRYASVSAHKGFEVSRKDDLESLAYVLMYLLILI